jgi:hypothetical protein
MKRGLLSRGLGEEGEIFIRRPCLLGTPGDMLKKALEIGIYLHRGPVGEPGGWLI